MEFILVALAVIANIAFIKWKFEKQRYPDALLDTSLLIGVMYLFSGSYSALVVGTIASAGISILLYFSPPRLVK